MTTRFHPPGGRLRGETLEGLPRLSLLVQGFNNDEADASSRYEAVVTGLAAGGVPYHRPTTV